jgi:hypothetical protein
MGALGGFAFGVDPKEAREVEDLMYEKQFAVELEEAERQGKPDPNARKRYDPKEQYRGISPATAAVSSPQSPAPSP